MTLQREMFLVVHEIVERIVTRYGYEKLGEFTFLLAQYAKHWDEFGSGEGFDFSHYSEAVLIYFDNVRSKIDEKHRQFIVNGEQMAKIASKRWEKENKKDRRREQKRQWYVDNSKKVNLEKRKVRFLNGVHKNDGVSSHVSSHGEQQHENVSVAKNDAYAYKNYEIMNHKKNRNNYDMAAVETVDNFPPPEKAAHCPSSGLTGHNRAERPVITGNMRTGNMRKHENGENTDAEQRTVTVEHKPPQPCGQLPTGERKLGNKVVQPPSVRPTIYAEDWIRIGDDFKVDLFDPVFEGFAGERKFLIRGFEMWCRKKLCGERHDKWWLKKLLGVNFYNRQMRRKDDRR